MEGHNSASDWWRWEHDGHVEGGVVSGAACDHWGRAGSDLELAASLGTNTYRFSVEWAKLEPEEGRWNEEAFAWYEALLGHCERLGLLPMLTLHHFTLPAWLAAEGGFSSKKSVSAFQRFVEKVSERLGPRVPLWCTFNEPMVLLMGSYVGGFMPPALFAPELFARACENIVRAHVVAYDHLHADPRERAGPFSHLPLQVGVANNMLDFLADRWWHPLEQSLARVIRRFYNRSWLDALTGRSQHFGVPFVLPPPRQVPEAKGRRTLDFVGVNYYTKAYVRWRPRDSSAETLKQLPLGVAFARRNEPQSDLGWAVHPQGFGSVLREAGAYGLPIYVTENGLADREDTMRSSYILSHLKEIAMARREGIDIRGFYYWSLLDNFEWIKGFGPRFGLFHVDYQTLARSARPSAQLYRRVIAAHLGSLAPSRDILENF